MNATTLGFRTSAFFRPHSRISRNSRLIPFFLAFLLCGCTTPKPLRGGKAITTPNPTGGISQTLTQGDNPSQPTRQDQETVRVRTYTLPAGTRIQQSITPIPSHSSHPALRSAFDEGGSTFILTAPVPVTEREETHAKTELGAAQKDTTREIGAKLSSLKGIVWVGLGLFIFGLASIFWGPLRAIIGSITTSAAITLGGIALMILPTLIVGNELLILGGVALAVGAWFLAHRHGHLRGLLPSSIPLPPREAPIEPSTINSKPSTQRSSIPPRPRR